jgi:hypothetical protein
MQRKSSVAYIKILVSGLKCHFKWRIAPFSQTTVTIKRDMDAADSDKLYVIYTGTGTI